VNSVLEACSAAGVREFCVCAGARNVELVVGLERSSGCRVWHFFEERSAAFFALGRMMKTGRPVAVVTTSGTAVAELLPATVEAYYQSLPLVLITADRPASFRGSGAPQAIEQVGIFSTYARCIDLTEMRSTSARGCRDRECMGATLSEAVGVGQCVHINVCLAEPDAESVAALEGVEFLAQASVLASPSLAADGERLQAEMLEPRDGLVVMLGNLREDERVGLAEFLRRLGAPVLAEAGSGLREKLPVLCVCEVPDGIRRVLRIGGVPSGRFWRDLEVRLDVEVISVSRGGLAGLARDCTVVRCADWETLEIEPADAATRTASDEGVLTGELRWFRLLSEQIPAGSLVYLGNSLPIREWNQAATYEDRGLRCFSSRGANGIDGQLSTFFGLSEEEAESWVIVGDLTAMYDLSAPWALREVGSGKRRIVVINNGGGRIFSKLPALAGLADGERRAIENDHGVSLEHWAAMWGMGYVKVVRADDFVVDDSVAAMVIEIFVGGGAA
jgi:2-succinyl-5-enolpyruvyl-6-hydroxy-3-cyclohexene-1-carboxylate synthase